MNSKNLLIVKRILIVIALMLPLVGLYGYNFRNQNTIDLSNDNYEKRKKVVFKLGNYTSELEDFRDTAVKALELMSKVFSSKEFKDSLEKYSFPCSNAWFKENICKTPKNIIVYKCDSASNVVHGSTVYEDMLMEKNVTLNLNIIHPKGKTNSYGFSAACIYKINTYS